MAIVLKKVWFNDYNDLQIDSHNIIGVMGNNYDRLLESLKGDSIYGIYKVNNFKKTNVKDELLEYYPQDSDIKFEQLIQMFLQELGINDELLHKEINNLTHSEQRIVKYLSLLLFNPNIIVIDEPFLYCDLETKKKIKHLFYQIIRGTKKTIILGSQKSDIIYELCEKILIFNDHSYIYDDIRNVICDKMILDKYRVKEPEIVSFVRLAREKKININYTKDIRDLMKEVYKNV